MNVDDATPYLSPRPLFLYIIYDPGKSADV